MIGPFLQVVITAWISAAHPVTFTLPKIYFDPESCEARVERFMSHWHPPEPGRASVECVPTDQRAI